MCTLALWLMCLRIKVNGISKIRIFESLFYCILILSYCIMGVKASEEILLSDQTRTIQCTVFKCLMALVSFNGLILS